MERDLTISTRECEDRAVTECSVQAVPGLCPEVKIVNRCEVEEDCQMFSCNSAPEMR